MSIGQYTNVQPDFIKTFALQTGLYFWSKLPASSHTEKSQRGQELDPELCIPPQKVQQDQRHGKQKLVH
jgi:hypothetical protein